ncbi:MAG: hypothetical protein ACRD3O_04225 [Terriglobia bacterium]
MSTSVSTPGSQLERRERFRAYMKAFNPTAPAREVIEAGLVFGGLHSSLFRNLAARADLEPGSQQLLVGGIGSGKTTELILAERWLTDRGHIWPLYIDISAETDLSRLSSGSLLAGFGLHLARRVLGGGPPPGLEPDRISELQKAYHQVKQYAYGKTVYVRGPEPEPPDDEYEEEGYFQSIPGKLKPAFPALMRHVQEIGGPLEQFMTAAREMNTEIVVVFDGLDRLLDPTRFWSVAQQDLRLLRQLKVSVISTAPISVLFGRAGIGQAVSDHFDKVHHLPAIATDPEQGPLQVVLATRRGYDMLGDSEAELICQYSGGVLRDLISLARDAAEEAYVSDRDVITEFEITKVVHQLGTAYLRGLGPEQIKTLLGLEKTKSFEVSQPVDLELLVTRRVLEYSPTDFRVHPALLAVIPRPEPKRA